MMQVACVAGEVPVWEERYIFGGDESAETAEDGGVEEYLCDGEDGHSSKGIAVHGL